jgi:hypothetical protein
MQFVKYFIRSSARAITVEDALNERCIFWYMSKISVAASKDWFKKTRMARGAMADELHTGRPDMAAQWKTPVCCGF